MNKKKVDDLLPKAYEALTHTGIANQQGEIPRSYRGQIATFGAAVMSGSVLSAIAFFSGKGESDTDRPLLMKAILKLLDDQYRGSLFDYAKKRKDDPMLKDDVFDAAIALKLAMNLYKLTEPKNQTEAKPDE